MAMTDWFHRLPKVELHVHLEGSIPLPALWRLVQRHGGDPAVPDEAALARRFAYTDFAAFIRAWGWKNAFIRDADDLAAIAEAAARAWAGENIRYVEAHCSPPDFRSRGLSTAQIIAAYRRGLDRVAGIEVALIVDLVRDFGTVAAERTVEEVAALRPLGVVGIGLGGSEAEHPPVSFARAFARARALGLRRTAHAGEAAGPESVRGALAIGAERIGHGVRALEDPALVAELAARGVPLEVCPASNRCTGVVPPGAAPIRALRDAGVHVTLNSDDPAMFGVSLSAEYAALAQAGWTRDGLRALVLAGVAASWLPVERKAALAGALRADPAWDEPDVATSAVAARP